MKKFIGEDFLIENEKGLYIYEKYARDLPIYDYHCHLSPEDIALDKKFTDIGELFLSHDHYKWRLMRTAGIDEKYITGDGSYKEKFIRYAKALEYAFGNPLYHWTHMELKEYFGISRPLNEKNAERIYEEANEKMSRDKFCARNLISRSKVEYIATTDDPADSLVHHRKIAGDESFNTLVVPTFRPDSACNPSKEGYADYLERLGSSEGIRIKSLENLLETLKKRMEHFSKAGCVCADHGVEYIPDRECGFEKAKEIFSKALSCGYLSREESDSFLRFMLVFLAGEYKKRDWAMQIHMSVIRNQNPDLLSKAGTDCGADSVGNLQDANSLGKFLGEVQKKSGVPKTMLFTLNPASYYILATAAGNFAGDVPGKVQVGPAWWFCDHLDGIEKHLRMFAETSLLGLFNGMLTDSRSFTSYVRHDYFRRIFCSLVGQWIEKGMVPDDEEHIQSFVQGVCFENAKKYFGI